MGGMETIYIGTNSQPNDKGKPSVFSFDLSTNELRQILDGYELLEISPNGKRFMVFKPNGEYYYNAPRGELFITNADGTDPVLISSKSIAYGAGFEDNDSLTFMEFIGGNLEMHYYEISDGSIRRLDPTTGRDDEYDVETGLFIVETGDKSKRILWKMLESTSTGYKSVLQEFSPDWQYALMDYDSGTRIPKCDEFSIISSEGTIKTPIEISNIMEDPPKNTCIDNAKWSPDSKSIFLWLWTGFDWGTDFVLYQISVEGKLIKQFDMSELFEVKDSVEFYKAVGSGVFSPDGKLMLFSWRSNPRNLEDIQSAILNVETGEIKPLSFGLPESKYDLHFFWPPKR
jgi:hypothetical protein